MALMFGTAGLPHILMRFFTVPDAKQARKSVFWATTWIGYFYLLIFIIGFGAITLVLTNPQFARYRTGVIKGGGGAANMAAVLVAKCGRRQYFPRLHLGGGVRHHPGRRRGTHAVGRIGRVARPLRRRSSRRAQASSAAELKVSRITTLALGIIAVALGIAFERQNIAFMVSLAFAIAASANFPVLFMSVLWKDCTTRGAMIGRLPGPDHRPVVLTVRLAVGLGSDARQSQGSALFPYTSPALFSMTTGFVGIWLFSITDRSRRRAKERAGFQAKQVRSETGLGASGASGH